MLNENANRRLATMSKLGLFSDEDVTNDRIMLEAFSSYPDSALDEFVQSDNVYFRLMSAYLGRDEDLDVLVNDVNDEVRGAVALCGRDKDLDILVHDESEYVRGAVAGCGRDKDLNILENDESSSVRDMVTAYRDSFGSLSVEESQDVSGVDNPVADIETASVETVSPAADEFNEKVNRRFDIMRKLGASEMDIAGVQYVIRGLASYPDEMLDEFVQSGDVDQRASMALLGRDKDLDILVNDVDPGVRSIVALCGRDKDLAILENDESSNVREVVERCREQLGDLSAEASQDLSEEEHVTADEISDDHQADNDMPDSQETDDSLDAAQEEKPVAEVVSVENEASVTHVVSQTLDEKTQDMSNSKGSSAVFINGIDPAACVAHTDKSGDIVKGRVDVDIPFDLGQSNFGSMYNLSEKQIIDDKRRPGKVSLILDASREYSVYAHTPAAVESGRMEKLTMTGAEIKEHAEKGMEKRREYVAEHPQQYQDTSKFVQSIVPDDGFGTDDVEVNAPEIAGAFDFE